MNNIKVVDTKISFWFSKQYHHKIINRIMMIVSKTGDLGLVWLVIITITTLLPNGRYASQRMLFALLLATFVGQIVLKSLVKRKRPTQRYTEIPILIDRPRDSSFPSGHTTSSFACASVICFYTLPLGILALCFATLMGISRVYLFVHYISDIVYAMLLGISIGIIVMLF
jgi:undecaprenyl-diphosphatase